MANRAESLIQSKSFEQGIIIMGDAIDDKHTEKEQKK